MSAVAAETSIPQSTPNSFIVSISTISRDFSDANFSIGSSNFISASLAIYNLLPRLFLRALAVCLIPTTFFPISLVTILSPQNSNLQNVFYHFIFIMSRY